MGAPWCGRWQPPAMPAYGGLQTAPHAPRQTAQHRRVALQGNARVRRLRRWGRRPSAQISAPCASAGSGGLPRCKYSQYRVGLFELEISVRVEPVETLRSASTGSA